jgi:hypothetical protein
VQVIVLVISAADRASATGWPLRKPETGRTSCMGRHEQKEFTSLFLSSYGDIGVAAYTQVAGLGEILHGTYVVKHSLARRLVWDYMYDSSLLLLVVDSRRVFCYSGKG